MRSTAAKLLALGLVVLCGAVAVWLFRSWTVPPDTPGNATIDFFNDGVLRDGEGAWDRLCSPLQDSAFNHEGDDFDQVRTLIRSAGGLSVSDEVPTRIDDDDAVVVVEVRPFGIDGDQANVEWSVSLVRERGEWRVCGVEPRR